MGNINLTMHDVRNVLGKRNDGDVVFKPGGDGVERLGKVNYGRVFTHEKTASDPAMNRRVRDAIFTALSNSYEAKVLGEQKLREICAKYGLGTPETAETPLTRRAIFNIVKDIDGRVTGQGIVDANGVSGKLQAKGVFDEARFAFARDAIGKAPFSTKDAMLKALPKKAFGLPSSAVKRFVNDNFALLQAKSFDNVYFLKDQQHFNSAQLLTRAFGEIAAAYAHHREPTMLADYLQPAPEVRAPEGDLKTCFESEAMSAVRGGIEKLFAVKEDASHFTGLNLPRIGGHVKNAVLETLQNALAKGDDAQTAFAARFPNFAKLTKADMAALDEDFTLAFVRKLNAEIYGGRAERTADTSDVQGAMALAEAADKVLGEMLKDASLDAIVDAEIAKAAPDATTEQAEELRQAVGKRLAEAQGEQARNVGRLRSALATHTENADDPGIFRGRQAIGAIVAGCVKARGENVEARGKYMDRIFNVGGKFMVDSLPKGFPPAETIKTTNGDVDLKTLYTKLLVLQTVTGVGNFAKAGMESGLCNEERRMLVDAGVDEAAKAKNAAYVAKLDAAFGEIDTTYLGVIADYLENGGEQCDMLLTEGLDPHPLLTAARDGVLDLKAAGPSGMAFLSKMLERADDGVMPFVFGQPEDPENPAEIGETIVAFVKEINVGADPDFDASKYDKLPETLSKRETNVQKRFAAESFLARRQFSGAYSMIPQFGTADVKAIAQTLKDFGLSLADAKTDAGYVKLLKVQYLAMANGYHLDGLREWAERMTGKPFQEMTGADIGKLLNTKTRKKDPLDGLGGGGKTAADFLGGKLKTGEAKLSASPADTVALITGLRKLVLGSSTSFTTKIAGADVAFSVAANGHFSATVAGIPLAPAKAAADLLAQIENDITANVDKYPPEVVKGILPETVKASTLSTARLRELCTKILSAKLGAPGVKFAAMPTGRLLTAARDSVDGKFTARNLAAQPPATYNSAEVIELHQQLLAASPEERSVVKMPKAPGNAKPQDPGAAFRNLIGDLVLNKATWSFDETTGKSGGRVRDLLNAYQTELKDATADDAAMNDAVAALPQQARAGALELLKQIKPLLGDLANAGDEQFAAIEARIDSFAATVCGEMQKVASRLFVAKEGGDDKPTWQKSLSEVNGSAGLDTSTAQGKFVKDALDAYFKQSSPIEQRAMVAAFLRHTDANSSEGVLTAELLKGAGPLLQKTLQGLPIETFGPETQVALKDMKSKLAPIPEDVVEAQMYELVRTSGGKITGVEVKKSLGAATVGQAFLCRIYTKDHPVAGEEVVIKLLRPNVSTAIQREYDMLSGIARKNGMEKTFQTQYEGILKELDFTLEAENIDLGKQAYTHPQDQVLSMTLNPNAPVTRGALVLSKVEGDTYDGFITKTLDDATQMVQDRTKAFAAEKGGPAHELCLCKDMTDVSLTRGKLAVSRQDLMTRLDYAMNFVRTWTEEALFGKGFFHGDLHAGNLMTDGKTLSVIDYGNATRLTAAQQNAMKLACAACIVADGDTVLGAIASMLTGASAQRIADLRKNAGFMSDFQNVVSKGSGSDIAQRLTGVVAFLQQHGLEIPAEVNAFIQSMARLQGVVTGLENAVRELEADMAQLQLDPEMQAKFAAPAEKAITDVVPECAFLDKAMLAASGTGGGPDGAEAEKALADLKAFVGAQKQRAPEIKAAFTADPKKAVAFFNALYARYGERFQYVRTSGGKTYTSNVWLVDEYAFGDLNKLLAVEPVDAVKLEECVGRAVDRFFSGMEGMHGRLTDMIANCEPKSVPSFEDAVTDVMFKEEHKTDLVALGVKAYGVSAAKFQDGLFQALDFRDTFNGVVQAANNNNANLKDGKLDFRQRSAIIGEAKCFRKPFQNAQKGFFETQTGANMRVNDSPDGKKLPQDPAELANVIKVNLNALKVALGKLNQDGQPLETLSDAQLKYYFDVADGALMGNLSASVTAENVAQLKGFAGNDADMVAFLDLVAAGNSAWQQTQEA